MNRRMLLRGACGVAVALPFLDAMVPAFGRRVARADTAPKRLAVMWGGISYGSDGRAEDFVVPTTTGASYETTRGLAPLDSEGVKDRVTVFSNLLLPWEEGGVVPPGGRSAPYHYNTMGPLFSGMRGPAGERSGAPRGPTCDQIVASAIAGTTTFPVLAYRVQPAGYVGTNEIGGDSGALSWSQAPDGTLRRVDPTVSPRQAFEDLFTGFTPDDPVEAERARRALRQRASVLDLVSEDMQRVMREVGPSDRRRLEEHFTHLRALEERVRSTPVAMGSCRLPMDPGMDPPIGGAIIEYEGAGMPYSVENGYSSEDERADVLTDLVAMAFTCDRSRVASLMITEWKCYMNMFQLFGWRSDMHECTHGADGTSMATADAIAFHVKQLARLVRKLDAITDVDGASVLDNTALALVFEGGKGHDPEGNTENSAHSTEHMVALLAGGAGGMTHGQHVDGGAMHPASVFVSAMQAVGVTDALGEVSTSAMG
ncbi:MAG: DUF1552 domain-containing protein [Sandaracinus sp.]